MAGEKKTKTDKVTGKDTGKTTKKAPVSKPASKAASKTDKKVSGKTASQTTGKTAGKTVSKTTSSADKGGKTQGPTSKTASKPASKTIAKPASKTASKTTAKTGPAASRPLMDEQAFIEKMEQALFQLKEEINENLMANHKDFKEIVEGMDPKDLADIASDDIDRKIIEALGSQELKRLKLIESAIGRIKQGKYGCCIKCGVHIPQERLEALPYALMCIKCKTEEERRNR